ncbi:MAG: hypothetical protein WD967_00695 [Candidatus Levyibacteriota bacterium]
MTQERDPNIQGQPEVGKPFPTLEKLFDTSNAANIVILESAGNGRRDPRIGIDTLADKYAGIFGRTGTPRRRREEFDLGDIFERDEYARPGDSYVMEMVRQNEAKFMAKVLLSPSKDPEQVRQRQELIGSLAASEHLDELINLKDRSWRVFEGLWNFRQILGNYRWEDTSLIEHYYAGTEFVPILEDEYNRNSRVLEKEVIMDVVGEAVDRINGGIAGFTRFGEALDASEDPLIRQAFSGIPEDIVKLQADMSTLIPLDKKPAEKGKHYPEEKRDELEELVKKIEPYFFSQSAMLEFAKKVRDEGWQPVSSDHSLPYGYTEGWNLEEDKKGQVRNDSPTDAPITVLSGANTSGKSFTMKSDFLIRVAAQSLGYAPVASGNLPQFDSFIFLDRAATDPENDLSAFMREVENWKIALQDVNSRTRLYADEGYSTTSPHDQASLLLATADYIQDRGGSVMLATHNDLLLDAAEQNQDMQVYNLQTEIKANGDLQRHFKLQQGRSESLSYAVARAKQFPSTALGVASRYLETGKIEPSIVIGAEYPKITAKSSEQREQEKQVAATLEQLFPAEPNNPVFHLFSLDPEMTPHGLLWHVSGGRRQETVGIYEANELISYLGQMILWQPSQTPAEVLERQQLFGELTKDGRFKNLPEMTGDIGFLEETIAVVGKHAKDGINKGLNPFQLSDEDIAKMMKDIVLSIPRPHQFNSMLKAIDAYLGIQIRLFGNLPPITELKNRFSALGEVNSAVLERWKPYGENPLTDEEQSKAIEAIGNDQNEDLSVVDLHKAIVGMFASLREVTDQLPGVGIKDMPVSDLAEELDILETYNRGGEKKEETKRPRRSGMMGQMAEMFDLMMGGTPMVVRNLPGMMENAHSLVQALKSTNSVHLHQVANVIEAQLAKHEAILSGEAGEVIIGEIQGTLPAEATSKFNHLSRRSGSLFFRRQEPKATPYKAALKQVEALAMFAGIIEKQGFSKVAFNDTGELHFENAFSIFKDRSDEVANTIDLSSNDTRVQILTGPNGSGKTFYEKSAVAGVLMGLATGYAPAEQATMPVFDAVIYLDRVVEKQDSSYSAFSQEVEYWKELLGLLPEHKAVFAAVDEAFSTTSPGYQGAFTSAVVAEFLNSPHFLMLSTHNHDAVASLTGSGVNLTKPYHFAFDVEDQRIQYQYSLREGHQTSHAVEVARTMGLPEEITNSIQSV